jgi:HlyD family secretion protein
MKMRKKRVLTLTIGAALGCVAMAGFAMAHWAAPKTAALDLPIARVKRGDLTMRVYVTGELRASQSQMLMAPPIGGGALQITHLLHTGTAVKRGELVIEFDPAEQRYNLEQQRSELMQADQEITKAKADAAVQAAQDKVALLKARFDVRRAELDVQKNELVSPIDAQKNNLALEGANRVLAELEQDVKSRSVSNQAAISLAEEKRNKAKLAMDQAQSNIDKMRVTAPMDGLIALEKNQEAAGGFFFSGMTLPEYREGDQVEPGRTVAQIIDPSGLELAAKVGEIERNNIKPGQSVDIVLDAMPADTFHGTVKTVGAGSAHMFWDDDSGTKFEVSVKLASVDSRMRPGMTGHVSIDGDTERNVLYIPRQALFLKDGKRIAYVRNGNDFDPREVKVEAENESRAAIQGLGAGTEVALIDPTAPRKTGSASARPSAGGTP